MTKIDGYWTDNNNNTWNCDVYTEGQAIKNSASLINCIDCIDCRGCGSCRGCRDCRGCGSCRGCRGCRGCIGCRDCIDCTGCGSCSGCSGCRGCRGCIDCRGCRDRIDCSGLRIDSHEDRKTVAGILIDNGYCVELFTENKGEHIGSKQEINYLIISKKD
jgi:hypothetical protein